MQELETVEEPKISDIKSVTLEHAKTAKNLYSTTKQNKTLYKIFY